MKLRKIFTLLLVSVFIVACSNETKDEEKIVTIAAAASLENAFVEEIIPLYQKNNEGIKIAGVYDASGKLQTQIEEGLDADIFISAANKQIDSLIEKGLIKKENTSPLLKNEVVLITHKDSKTAVTSFENITDAKMIAIGDPDSVPAGTYAKEILENLKKWDKVSKNASLGTNVTEVLEWVAAENAEIGIVYSSDAKSNNEIKVIDTATTKHLKTDVTYPIGLIENSENKEEAQKFIDFLKTDEVQKIFEKYGFTRIG